MRRSPKITREAHEYEYGYKILGAGQGRFTPLQEQESGYCERVFGMSEANLSNLIGKLENAVETITKNSDSLAKTVEDIDKRLLDIETKIQFASWLRWGFISFCALLWQFWDWVIFLLKKIP
jgi:hypothetical protein